MSPAREIATLEPWAFRLAPIGMEEEIAVATFHEVEPQTRKADGPVTQIVCLPAASREPVTSKQGRGNLAIGDVFEPRVECAEREDETFSPCC